jgi:hypothetical protein
MAGTRQHHLPQFLQRGFASRSKAQAHFTWVYRKGKAPFEANIEDVGVERKFYTQGTDSSVDSTITDADSNEFSRTVALARTGSLGVIQSADFPRLFAHLEVRSRQLREVFAHTSENLLARIMRETQDRLPEVLLERWANNPELFNDSVRKYLEERGLSSLYSDQLADTARSLAPAALREIRPLLMQVAAAVTTTFPGLNRESIKAAHINALRETVAPEVRVRHYQSLVYSVVEVSEAELILGDGAVVFNISGSKPFKPMSEVGDEIIAALLPISFQRIVVGSHDPHYQLDPDALRNAIASCSHEFFIAAKFSAENERLMSEIGRSTNLISSHELDQMIDATLRELRLGK